MLNLHSIICRSSSHYFARSFLPLSSRKGSITRAKYLPIHPFVQQNIQSLNAMSFISSANPNVSKEFSAILPKKQDQQSSRRKTINLEINQLKSIFEFFESGVVYIENFASLEKRLNAVALIIFKNKESLSEHYGQRLETAMERFVRKNKIYILDSFNKDILSQRYDYMYYRFDDEQELNRAYDKIVTPISLDIGGDFREMMKIANEKDEKKKKEMIEALEKEAQPKSELELKIGNTQSFLRSIQGFLTTLSIVPLCKSNKDIDIEKTFESLDEKNKEFSEKFIKPVTEAIDQFTNAKSKEEALQSYKQVSLPLHKLFQAMYKSAVDQFPDIPNPDSLK